MVDDEQRRAKELHMLFWQYLYSGDDEPEYDAEREVEQREARADARREEEPK